MLHGIHPSKGMCPKTPKKRMGMDKIPYASIMGSIMYVMLCIRLDVSHALSVMSRYQANLGEGH